MTISTTMNYSANERVRQMAEKIGITVAYAGVLDGDLRIDADRELPHGLVNFATLFFLCEHAEKSPAIPIFDKVKVWTGDETMTYPLKGSE